MRDLKRLAVVSLHGLLRVCWPLYGCPIYCKVRKQFTRLPSEHSGWGYYLWKERPKGVVHCTEELLLSTSPFLFVSHRPTLTCLVMQSWPTACSVLGSQQCLKSCGGRKKKKFQGPFLLRTTVAIVHICGVGEIFCSIVLVEIRFAQFFCFFFLYPKRGRSAKMRLVSEFRFFSSALELRD